MAAGRFPPARAARLPPPGHRPLAAGTRASARRGPDSEFLPAGAQARGADRGRRNAGPGSYARALSSGAQARISAGGRPPPARCQIPALSVGLRGRPVAWRAPGTQALA